VLLRRILAPSVWLNDLVWPAQFVSEELNRQQQGDQIALISYRDSPNPVGDKAKENGGCA
jgi:hypothetical protein